MEKIYREWKCTDRPNNINFGHSVGSEKPVKSLKDLYFQINTTG